ncbi:hypothetical protein MXD81_27725, partial [Microbacteriaceae bacterium K1510]|nr:hypothetical protein [Microbacteriaceae bacterium K1510]
PIERSLFMAIKLHIDPEFSLAYQRYAQFRPGDTCVYMFEPAVLGPADFFMPSKKTKRSRVTRSLKWRVVLAGG